MWPNVLAEPLRGKTSLWKVVWIYGFGASVVYTLLGWMFVPETPFGITVYFLFGLALGILQSVMLWQCAYTELVFLDRLWPDFTRDDLEFAIREYHGRDRRYGAAR